MYNASAVKILQRHGSLVRFEDKNIFFYYKNALAYYTAGVVAINLKVARLASGYSRHGEKLRRILKALKDPFPG
jgi:hypothetical protein